MSRVKWKGVFLNNNNIIKKVLNTSISRASSIPNIYLNKYINIHTGKEYKKIFISKEKIGLKAGTFAYTRKGKSKFKIL